MRGKKFILGIGHTKFLLMLTTAMYYLRPKAMKKSIVFAMGGNLAELVEDKPVMIKRLQRYRRIYVEPTGMMKKMQKMGAENISLLPNCRVRPAIKREVLFKGDGNISFVFFSRISPDKGIDMVLGAAKKLADAEFHLYGEIDSAYGDTFTEETSGLTNVTYHGVFKGKDSEVYDELSKYDVMLLPTRWKKEGVPGVLVEAKIAGVPAIVSDICYNAEIVEDGVSGIVLKDNTIEELTKEMERLDADREELYRLKCGAKQSAEMYYIENYISDIINNLGGGGLRHKGLISVVVVIYTCSCETEKAKILVVMLWLPSVRRHT